MEIICAEVDYPIYIVQKEIYEREHRLSGLNEAEIQKRAEDLYRKNIQANNLNIEVKINGTDAMLKLQSPIRIIRTINRQALTADLEISEIVKKAVVEELDSHVRCAFKDYPDSVRSYARKIFDGRKYSYQKKLRFYRYLCGLLSVMILVLGYLLVA